MQKVNGKLNKDKNIQRINSLLFILSRIAVKFNRRKMQKGFRKLVLQRKLHVENLKIVQQIENRSLKYAFIKLLAFQKETISQNSNSIMQEIYKYPCLSIKRLINSGIKNKLSESFQQVLKFSIQLKQVMEPKLSKLQQIVFNFEQKQLSYSFYILNNNNRNCLLRLQKCKHICGLLKNVSNKLVHQHFLNFVEFAYKSQQQHLKRQLQSSKTQLAHQNSQNLSQIKTYASQNQKLQAQIKKNSVQINKINEQKNYSPIFKNKVQQSQKLNQKLGFAERQRQKLFLVKSNKQKLLKQKNKQKKIDIEKIFTTFKVIEQLQGGSISYHHRQIIAKTKLQQQMKDFLKSKSYMIDQNIVLRNQLNKYERADNSKLQSNTYFACFQQNQNLRSVLSSLIAQQFNRHLHSEQIKEKQKQLEIIVNNFY